MSDASEALFGMVLQDQDEVASRVREALKARLPIYRNLPLDEFDREVSLEVGRVLQCARADRVVLNEDGLRELAPVGEARAQQGVPLADVLRAWRIGAEVTIRYAREVGQHVGVGEPVVLDYVESLLAWSDVAMATIAEAHRKAEFSLARAEQGRRAAFTRGALFGTIPATELGIYAEAYGVNPAGEYVAVRARAGGGVSTLKLEQALGFADPPEWPFGFCTRIGADISGFLSRPPPRDVDGFVGYGPPCSLDHLPDSYRLASRALMTAHACGLSGAHDIASLGLRAAVVMDIDVGESLRKRYLKPLGTGGSARELIATLRAYLACGMHVERAATQLRVHQNTVRYRLARFEELTGTSLHDTEVLFEAWWALELSGMRP